MAGTHHLDDAGRRVGLGVEAGRETVGVQLVEEDRGPGHHRGRGVPFGRVGAQDDAQLSHDGRRVRVVPLNVSDDRTDPAAGEGDDVVPVPADVPADPCGSITHRDLRAGHCGDPARQHGLLEPFGEIVFLVVEDRALDALRNAAAQRDQDIAILGAEAGAVAVEQAERTDRTGLGDERQIGRRYDAESFEVRPEDRVGLGEVGLGLDEAGASVRTTSLIGYSSSTRVQRVPGMKACVGPSATRWMRPPASSSPITRLAAPKCSRPWEAVRTSMTSWTVRACASAAVVDSTTLVCRLRWTSASARAAESASSSVASRTMPMIRSGRPFPSRRTHPWVWVQRSPPSRRRMRK